MGLRWILSAPALCAMGAALWLGGCSAYSSSTGAFRAAPAGTANYRQPGRVALASWYGPGFQGRRTSNGEIFDRNKLTAASRTLPIGSHVRVTNLRNGRSVVVRINDRGPYVRGRSIDLSQHAAERIGLVGRGVGRVEVSRVDAGAVRDRRRETWRVHRSKYRHPRRSYRYERHSNRYAYASASHGMVANPVGDWLLGMVR